jgi:positive regulator of sigma E activity
MALLPLLLLLLLAACADSSSSSKLVTAVGCFCAAVLGWALDTWLRLV